ncbi:unnamed protein product [Dovyalis caffra]|uniref:BRCT domain-containing protein n=1 Tax=Dovyalis caffra TaxID=77055 RepID=A0AAV1SFP0_9ROSI|nr:unnamed protein product [Dovyalis caffra]
MNIIILLVLAAILSLAPMGLFILCYGENYVLADKMKKIKLVNHRWLEDCGYELEMLEAEAKDSVDEAEGTSMKQPSYENANKSPQNLKARTSGAFEMPKTGEVMKISHNLSDPEGLSSVVNAKDILVTPGQRSRGDHASGFDHICVSEVPRHLDASGFKGAPSNELLNPQERTPVSTRTSNDLEFISRSVDRPSHSDAKIYCVEIAHNVSMRKMKAIMEQAAQLDVVVSNMLTGLRSEDDE